VTTIEATDADLLTRFRAGDDAALGRLFERYEGPVFRFLFGVLKDHHQAEDALQETFIQALRKADGIDPATFRGWLFTVAYQQGMLQKRRARRRPAPAEPEVLLGLVADGSAPDAERADDVRAVNELLAMLPAAQREVIRLRVYDGLRFRDVAERLGCPLNTALARMHDGVRRLRALWEARRA
jgi:RNA polymerase sigma-70 factor (ECF subfamily)